jgi:hypothetical protein
MRAIGLERPIVKVSTAKQARIVGRKCEHLDRLNSHFRRFPQAT